jgi:hypothetical protein
VHLAKVNRVGDIRAENFNEHCRSSRNGDSGSLLKSTSLMSGKSENS